jgi:hypothetical protein
MIGNGIVNESVQGRSFPAFAHAQQLIPAGSTPRSEAAARLLVRRTLGYAPNFYDYRLKDVDCCGCTSYDYKEWSGMRLMIELRSSAPSCPALLTSPVLSSARADWFLRSDVKTALNVCGDAGTEAFGGCAAGCVDLPGFDRHDTFDYSGALSRALQTGWDVTFYYGKQDTACNWVGGLEMANTSLAWGGALKWASTPFEPLVVAGANVGQVRKATGPSGATLSFLAVDGAGHMVPMDNAPAASVALATLTHTKRTASGTPPAAHAGDAPLPTSMVARPKSGDVPRIPIRGVGGATLQMPLVGLGTWRYGNDSVTQQGVQTALSVGYRHVDAALGYGNQRGVGAALAAAGVKRSDYWITSKVPGGLNASAMEAALEESVAQLGLAYVDLMLVHYPASWSGVGGPQLRKEGWLAMEAWARRTGKAKALGVSHYCRRHLDDVLSVASEPVALNQVQYHVGMGAASGANASVRHDPEYMRSHGVVYAVSRRDLTWPLRAPPPPPCAALCRRCQPSGLCDGRRTRRCAAHARRPTTLPSSRAISSPRSAPSTTNRVRRWLSSGRRSAASPSCPSRTRAST